MKPDAILPSVMIRISISVIPVYFLLTEAIMCCPKKKKKKISPRDFVGSEQN